MYSMCYSFLQTYCLIHFISEVVRSSLVALTATTNTNGRVRVMFKTAMDDAKKHWIYFFSCIPLGDFCCDQTTPGGSGNHRGDDHGGSREIPLCC